MNGEVKHDLNGQKFYMIFDEKEAYLRYLMNDNNVMNMIKTYVPPELRGRKIADAIVLKAMEYARENNLKIIPTCSYIETFIRRHEEFENLVKEF